MCSPQVHQAVHERIQREGLPTFSRRNFLKLGSITAAGLAVASAVPARRAAAQEMTGGVVDLTHVFGTNIPTYLIDEKPQREDYVTVEANGFYIQRWNFTEHASTHVDAPAHFVAGAETIDTYAAANLISPLVVIDISAKAADNADATLDVADIEAWLAENGEIPAGALVCMYSGWDTRWESIEDFRNADDAGVMHFPGFSAEAATYLLEEHDIHGIGVDTLSLDPGPSATFDVHYAVLGAGKYGVEGLNNLSQLIGTQANVVIGVPRWEAGSGGPCRALALT